MQLGDHVTIPSLVGPIKGGHARARISLIEFQLIVKAKGLDQGQDIFKGLDYF